jgi:hypothetical protein
MSDWTTRLSNPEASRQARKPWHEKMIFSGKGVSSCTQDASVWGEWGFSLGPCKS